ncbi:MAG: DUF6438 domain-containing protein [Pyrinomonadaceae bacterium]|nr:DUF6438 domain-containing protein [Pyrinomonadaceae bacterium]
MKKTFAISILLLLCLSVSAQEKTSDWQVVLERKGCLGGCPVYKITVDGTGNVVFVDRDGVASTGKLSKQDLQRLYRLSRVNKFLNITTEQERECDGPNETDWPVEIITVSANGRSKTVSRDKGCKPRPDTLLNHVVKLGEAIDELTDGMFIKK